MNSASQAELESLAGIGPAPFADWADLRRRVRCLAPALLRRLSEQGLRLQGCPYAEDAARPSVSAPTQTG